MAIKKSDLYRSLWDSCDELRGGMDASQYKDYVLTLLFVKYVSDKHARDPHSLIAVPDKGSFAYIHTLVGDKEIGDKINKAIGRLAEANDLRGVIDLADFNDSAKLGSGKEKVDRLSKLVRIFHARLDFSGNMAAGDDLLGDAYEYLMRHFATESGKSKGQFYTPAEVSRIIAQVIGIGAGTSLDDTVYDPTAGSGSLLLKAGDEAGGRVTIYGQEMDHATWALARMNMILHGQPTADIARGNTIASPQFVENGRLKTFDYGVANPPFSTKSWSNGIDPKNDDFDRFEYGVPPARNGDYAFLLHVIKSLKSTGTGAVVLPHGVLFRGNAEAVIRRNLLQRGLIKGVIGLPANLFYGTGIPACIVVVDKAGADDRDHVFMIDASKDYIKDGNKNRLRSQDIHKIVDVFTNEIEHERFSRRVPVAEIADPHNDYNLSIPRYIDSSEPDDIQDLHAHLHGGIPERDIGALANYWTAFPQMRDQLFTPNRPGYVDLALEPSALQQAVLESSEFQKLISDARGRTEEWFEAHRPALESISAKSQPKDLIRSIGEDLLARFETLVLLDEYDVYEQLMRYWHEVMHDDVFLIMQDGWKEAARPRHAIEDKAGKLSEDADLEIGSGRKKTKYKMDLIPPALVVARYFSDEQDRVTRLLADVERAAEDVAEFIEEHGSDEESLLADALNDKGALTRKATWDALVEAKEAGDEEAVTCLQTALKLLKAEAAAKKVAKEAQVELDEATLSKFGELSEQDVQSLVLDAKWAAAVRAGVEAEVEALMHELVARIRKLGERYVETVNELDAKLSKQSAQQANIHELLTGQKRLPRFAEPWRASTLGAVGTFLKGRGVKRSDVRTSGVPCIRYGELYTTFTGYTSATVSFVTQEVAESALPLQTGDLLFAGSGETREDIGVCVAYTGPTPAVAGGDIVVLRGDGFNPIFMALLMNSPEVVRQKARAGQGDAVVHIYSHALARIEVNLPSRAEQDAIADVIVAADTEIDLLRRRLTKAAAVKHGMLQEVITGHTRLPSGEYTP